jgi:tetratricopeptide (TPR) repeat protein
LDGTYAPGYLASGRVQAAQGHLKAAVRDFTQALEINPQYVQAYYYRGETHMQRFDFTQAERDFDSALQIRPTYAAARTAWERSMKIRLAVPGTHIGKKIVLVDPITRADLAALIATEFSLERALRRRRPEIFDPTFRPARDTRWSPPNLPPIRDVDGHWAKGFIELVTALYLMETFPDRTFRPDAIVDRASYAMAIQQILSIVDDDDGLRRKFIGSVSPFPDVRNDHFAYNAIMLATTRGMLEARTGSGAFNLTGSMSGADALLGLRKLAELF